MSKSEILPSLIDRDFILIKAFGLSSVNVYIEGMALSIFLFYRMKNL